jgi:ABC-type nitrate/sulfonate/bicarbonate transport system permease component
LKKKFVPVSTWLIPLGTGIGLLLLWEACILIFNVKAYISPSPSRILAALIKTLPLMGPHILTSLFTAVTGLLIAVLAGFFLSGLMDSVDVIKKALYPLMVLLQTVPLVFIYPLFMIWFGFGIFPKILVVIIICVFPISVNLVDGLGSADPELINLFKSMGASRVKTLLLVRIPSALPLFFSGLKVAATYSVMGAVIGEWMGAGSGIGVYMMRAYNSFAYANVFASIVVTVLLSLTIFAAAAAVERICISWKFIKEEQP